MPFTEIEAETHRFKKYLDELKSKQVEDENEQASKIPNSSIRDKYYPCLIDRIKNEWGYDSSIDVSNEPLEAFSFPIEKNSKAVNYDDVVAEHLSQSVFCRIKYDIKNRKSIIVKKDEQFDTNIHSILQKNIEWVTSGAINQSYYIKDPAYKNEYKDKMPPSDRRINSNILNMPAIILKDGFSFNCVVEEFIVKDLAGDELARQVDKYKRPDGQYEYKSLFMQREEIARALSKEYAVLSVKFRFYVRTYTNAIVIIG